MATKDTIATMKKTHIAIMPSPGMGHIIPLLELAKRLATCHDFHVSFLVFSTEASCAQNQLLESLTLFPHLKIILLPSIEVPSSLTDLVPRLVYIVNNTISKYLKSTILDLQDPPKALIIDMFCLETFGISKELSIPTYLFFTGSAALLAWLLYTPAFAESANGGVYTHRPETIHVPGCNPLVADDLINGDFFIGERIQSLKKFRESAGILVNTFGALEPVSLRAMTENPFFLNLPTPPIFPIGPLIKAGEIADDVTNAEEKIGDRCLNWLNAQPSDSVLFVSFGSGGTLSAEQIFELAFGLEQSGQRFIWVVRKPSDSSPFGSFFNVGSTVEDGPSTYLPKGFIERTREVGLVVSSWAPQVEILGHHATGGFLTHCGWNSILESIVCGVPMIAWPLFADQKMNARMICEELGIAARPSVERNAVVRRDEIKRTVRMVMQSEEGKVMMRKAKKLQDSAKKNQMVGSFDNSLPSASQELRDLFL